MPESDTNATYIRVTASQNSISLGEELQIFLEIETDDDSEYEAFVYMIDAYDAENYYPIWNESVVALSKCLIHTPSGHDEDMRF